jgi:putative RecB family exonuclease
VELFEHDDLGMAEPLFDSSAFEVVDPEAAERLLLDASTPPGEHTRGAPRHLSPSSASTFEQCERRWKFRYIDQLADPPGAAALAGTFAHRVLELLFQHPRGQRTPERAKVLAREVWPETEADPHFQALELDAGGAREFRWRSWLAIEGLWTLEDPTTIDVVATEQQVLTEVGGVPFRGIVDRLERNREGSLEITDYKSGRAPRARYSDDRLAQVLLYAAAVEASTGERPVRARLLYLGQKTVDTEVTAEAVAPVVAALGDTWGRLQAACESETFTPRTGPLCGWCPYAALCPEGQTEIRRRVELGTLGEHAPAVALLAGST